MLNLTEKLKTLMTIKSSYTKSQKFLTERYFKCKKKFEEIRWKVLTVQLDMAKKFPTKRLADYFETF